MDNVVLFKRPDKTEQPIEQPIQWFKRSGDNIFSTIEELYAHVRQNADLRWVKDVPSTGIGIKVHQDYPTKLEFEIEGQAYNPTHWAFGQLCQLIGFPASHYRRVPAVIMAPMLQYGIMTFDKEIVKVMGSGDVLRSITSPRYSRILDAEVVATASKILKDSEWSVPINSQNQGMNITSSDRDLFIFLQREDKRFEIDGKIFTPALSMSNSEVGARPFLLDQFYLVEDKRLMIGARRKVKHLESSSKLAAEILSELNEFLSEKDKAERLILSAKKNYIGNGDKSLRKYLSGYLGFSDEAVNDLLDLFILPGERFSLWDISQAIAHYATTLKVNSERFAVERKAGLVIT